MKRNRIALFPGSFDPFTVGHESIVRRALPLFDKIIIGIGENNSKTSLLNVDKRLEIISKVFRDETKIEICTYRGLTVDFCLEKGCNYILRGLRTSADFEFERAIGQTNKLINSNIETVFLLTLPEHTFISSGIVRDVLKNNGPVEKFLPKGITKEDLL